MTFWLSVAARWVHGIALALWLGGLIGIGALAAPAAFHATRAHVAFAGDIALQNDIAGSIIGDAFRHFNILCIACGLLMLVSEAVIARMGMGHRRARRLFVISSAATVVLLALAVYLQYGLFPIIDAAKLQRQWDLFGRLHHLYVALSNIQTPLLLVIAWIAAMRDTASASSIPSALPTDR